MKNLLTITERNAGAGIKIKVFGDVSELAPLFAEWASRDESASDMMMKALCTAAIKDQSGEVLNKLKKYIQCAETVGGSESN